MAPAAVIVYFITCVVCDGISPARWSHRYFKSQEACVANLPRAAAIFPPERRSNVICKEHTLEPHEKAPVED